MSDHESPETTHAEPAGESAAPTASFESLIVPRSDDAETPKPGPDVGAESARPEDGSAIDPEPEAAADGCAIDPQPEAAADGGILELSVENEMLAALARVETRLSESQRLIERQADVAARLHAENQLLRAGELRKAQHSLVVGVLRVFDDVRRMSATTTDPTGARDLELVADALADALARNGIDLIDVGPGDAFNPQRHKIANVAPTTEPEADRTVAEVVRPGFTWTDGEVVRVADVSVFKHLAEERRDADPVTDSASAPPTAQTSEPAEPAG